MELNQFGLLIYNANVEQLVDVSRHEFFSYLARSGDQSIAGLKSLMKTTP